MKNVIAGMAAVSLLSAGAMGDIQITEAFVGLDGADGTSDWFEITWTGAGTFDTSTLFYDDISADIGDAGQLDSFILSTGESAVFLVSSDAADVTEFQSIWGAGANVGLANGGGGLGQGGDAVYLLDSMGQVIEFVNTVGEHANLATFTYDAAGNQSESVLGVDGAYQSAFFFNDSVGQGPDFMISLVGSPGFVPAPGAVALLAMGGLVGARRRR